MKSFALASLLAVMLSAASLAHAAPPGIKDSNGFWILEKTRPLLIHVGDVEPGKSECTEACLRVWAPVLAESDAPGGPGWTIAPQADGRRIWAYEGKPVYTLIDPRRTGYDRESALWLWARVTPWNPPGVTTGEFGLLAKDDGGELRHVRHSECDEECETYWRPMAAPDDAVDVQNWAVIQNADGAKIWATEPGKRIVYEQRPGTTLPPPLTNSKDRLGFSSMVGISAVRRARRTTPIAIRPGVPDLHDLRVTKVPKLAPGATLPTYPMASLRAKEEGLAVLQFCIGANGAATSRTLAIPTGFERLDDATRAWAPTLKFVPGEVNGAPAETCGYALQFDWVIR